MSVSARSLKQTNKIIHAAAVLFARQGYHGTSTREIARVAEMSENTLFRHFQHKEDIFWAALRSHLNGLKLRSDLLANISQCADPGVVVPQILTQLTDTAILKPELLRLVAVALLEFNWKAAPIFREFLLPAFSAVTQYLAVSIETGRLRKLDPAMATVALAMTVMVHGEFLKLIGGSVPAFSDSRKAIQAYSRFWLDVLLPSPLDQRLP